MELYQSLVCSLAAIITGCEAVYFLLPENDRKCFTEEIPDETTVVGKFRMEYVDANSFNLAQIQGGSKSQPLGLLVTVNDPSQHVLMSRTYGMDGKFSFASNAPGDHQICLSLNVTRFLGSSVMRVHFNLSVGEHANDYAEIAQTGKLTEIQLRVRQLLDQINQITKEQLYQRVREERFRQLSEDTNYRVMSWGLIQTAVFLGLGFWQMNHLKSFFEAKKVV